MQQRQFTCSVPCQHCRTLQNPPLRTIHREAQHTRPTFSQQQWKIALYHVKIQQCYCFPRTNPEPVDRQDLCCTPAEADTLACRRDLLPRFHQCSKFAPALGSAQQHARVTSVQEGASIPLQLRQVCQSSSPSHHDPGARADEAEGTSWLVPPVVTLIRRHCGFSRRSTLRSNAPPRFLLRTHTLIRFLCATSNYATVAHRVSLLFLFPCRPA